MRYRLVALLVVLAGGVGWAQGMDDVLQIPPSAPAIGDTEVSLKAAGTLVEVLQAIAKASGKTITYDPGAGAAGEPDRSKSPVHITAWRVPLQLILLSICQQAGLVYEWPAAEGGAGIVLHSGDQKLDSRPTAVVGDYVVRVTFVRARGNREFTFRWGEGEPKLAPLNRYLTLGLSVTTKIPGATRLLAGLRRSYTITPDIGPVTEWGKDAWPGWFIFFEPNWGDDANRFQHEDLPYPGQATKIARLEGALALFSTVKVTEVKVLPDRVGQIFTQDDVSVTVKSWSVNPSGLVMQVVAQALPLPHDKRYDGYYGCDRQTAALVLKDGREIAGFNQTYLVKGGKDMGLSFGFGTGVPAPGAEGGAGGGPVVPLFTPEQIDYLRLTFYRGGDADKTVPFVLENIPLPPLQ